MTPDASTSKRVDGKSPTTGTTRVVPSSPVEPTEVASAPTLSLTVQYGVDEPLLPRWRLRRWISGALATMARDANAKAAGLPEAVVLTLRLVGTVEGRQLNQAYRGRDYATNVLTFEYGADPNGAWHGDIILCVPVLKREAREQKKTLLAHAAHLTIHGVLHSLGYDHIDDTEASAMESLEIAILDRLKVANPYE